MNLKRSPLELLLKVLDVDGAVQRVTGGWVATGQPWVYDAERYERIAAARVQEQNSMLEYERTTGCRMEFLQRALDDDTAVPCGRCDNCAAAAGQPAWYPTDVRQEASGQAQKSLSRVGVAIEPRAQWPTGADNLGVPVRGKISPDERVETGRALARLTDLGWGGTLRDLFAPATPDAPASPALVQACIRVLAEWGWEERPAAVISIPSRRRPQLVDSVARALSDVGRLPYLGALSLKNGGPSGEPGGNSAYRLSSVWDRFDLDPELVTALRGLPRSADSARRRPHRQSLDAHRRRPPDSRRRGIRCAAVQPRRAGVAGTSPATTVDRSGPNTKRRSQYSPSSASGSQCLASSHMRSNGISSTGCQRSSSSSDSTISPSQAWVANTQDTWLQAGRSGNSYRMRPSGTRSCLAQAQTGFFEHLAHHRLRRGFAGFELSPGPTIFPSPRPFFFSPRSTS